MADGKVVIDTKLDTEGAVKDMKTLKSNVNRASLGIGKIFDSNVMQMTKNSIKNLGKNISSELNKTDSVKVLSQEYIDVQNQIDKATEKLNKLIARQEKMRTLGVEQSSARWKSLSYDIEETRNELKQANNELTELSTSGQKFVAERNIQDVGIASTQTANSLNNLNNVSSRTGSTFNKVKNSSSGLKSSLKSMGKVNSKIGGTIKKYALLAFGIRSVFAALRKMRTALIESLKNYAKFDSEYSKVATNFKTATSNFKASAASAFAPILKVVLPILTKLIQYATTAANSVAQLLNALQGKKTWTKATAQTSEYADSLGDAASNAKELNEQLGEYDKLSVIGKDGGGGSPSGAGGLGSYTTEDVSVNMSGLAEKIKSAIESGDFTDIGKSIASKLSTTLENIPWTDIKAGARKIASSTATFLNGFFSDKSLFTNLGTTFAEGVNTALEFGYTFITKTDWTEMANSVGTTIVSFLGKLDWKKFSGILSGLWQSLNNTLSGLITSVDWSNLPSAIIGKIKDFFSGFDWKGSFASTGTLLANALVATLEFTAAVGDKAKELLNAIGKYFKDHIKEAKDAGGNIVEGIFKGITDAFKGIGTWIYDNIFEPFIDGFKSVFGIHSPSTVMQELGGFLIAGLKEGIGDIWGAVKEKFHAFKQKVKSFFHWGDDDFDGWDELPPVGVQKLESAGNKIAEAIQKGVDDKKITPPEVDVEKTKSEVSSAASQIANVFGLSLNDDKTGLGAKCNSAMTKLDNNLKSGMDIVNTSLKDKSVILTTTFSNNFNGEKHGVNAKMNNIMGKVNTTLRTNMNTVNKSMKEKSEGTRDKLNDTLTDSKKGLGSIMASSLATAKSKITSEDWKTPGANLVEGLETGLKNRWGTNSSSGIIKMVVDLAKNLTSKIKAVFGIASPSKVWKNEIGVMLTAGLETGMEKGENSLIKTSVSLGEKLTSSFYDSVDFSENPYLGLTDVSKIPEIATGTKLPTNSKFMSNSSKAVETQSLDSIIDKVMNASSQTSSEKDINLYIDGEKLFTWTRRKNAEYVNRYGKPAYI